MAVTTHLHWNPAAPLQLNETKELLTKLSTSEFAQSPIIIGGDFNCDTNSEGAQRLVDAGFIDLDDQITEQEKQPESQDKVKFTTHVPWAPVPKLTDARRCDDVQITRLHPVKVDFLWTRT